MPVETDSIKSILFRSIKDDSNNYHFQPNSGSVSSTECCNIYTHTLSITAWLVR